MNSSFAAKCLASTNSLQELHQKVIQRATLPQEQCDREQALKIQKALFQLDQAKNKLETLNVDTLSSPEPLKFQNNRKSWQQIVSSIEKLNGLDFVKHSLDWFNTVRFAEFLLFHDTQRVVHEQPYDLDQVAAAQLPGIYLKIQKCLMDKNCLMPDFTSQELIVLTQRESSKHSWKLMAEAKIEEKRMWLGLLEYNLKSDVLRVSFHRNETLDTKENQILIPFYSEHEEFLRPKIQSAIDSYWKSADSELEIVPIWVQDPELNSVKVELNSKTSLAHYNTESGVVYVTEILNEAHLAHEIGHVLGFRDYYFLVWDFYKCEYVESKDPGDIMSNPELGTVRASAWSLLEDVYL